MSQSVQKYLKYAEEIKEFETELQDNPKDLGKSIVNQFTQTQEQAREFALSQLILLIIEEDNQKEGVPLYERLSQSGRMALRAYVALKRGFL